MELDEDLDLLYQKPLAEFIAFRNELAKRLRKDGDREVADRVKKLVKPSLTAWAVNQLHFRARSDLDALFAAGEELRRAHLADAEAHRSAAKVKREAISKLLAIAAGIFEEHGLKLHRGHRQRITQTLEALASGSANGEGEELPGRLTEDLEPPGFDALSGLASALGQLPRRRPDEPARFRTRPVAVTELDARAEPAEVVDLEAERRARARQREAEVERRRERFEQQLAEARRQVAEGEEKVTSLEREAAENKTALQAAETAAAETASTAEEAERRAREARDEARAASEAVRRVRLEADAASASLARARARLDEARRAVERLTREDAPAGPPAD